MKILKDACNLDDDATLVYICLNNTHVCKNTTYPSKWSLLLNSTCIYALWDLQKLYLKSLPYNIL